MLAAKRVLLGIVAHEALGLVVRGVGLFNVEGTDALIRRMRVAVRLAAGLHECTHSASLSELVDGVGDCTSANKVWLAQLSLAL